MILSNKNKNSFYGVIIKVKNLDVCRSFYRDILGLGAPIIDSSFWIEFKVQEDVALVLEPVIEGETIPEKDGRTSWLYKVEDLDGMIHRLEEHGYEPVRGEQERLGYRVYVFNDPEGNHIYLFSGKE